METRALCIAFFYAIGTAAGGIAGPLLFGWLIDNATASGDITKIAIGYYIGAALMIAGGHRRGLPRRQGRGPVAGGHRHAAHRRGRRQRLGRAATPETEHVMPMQLVEPGTGLTRTATLERSGPYWSRPSACRRPPSDGAATLTCGRSGPGRRLRSWSGSSSSSSSPWWPRPSWRAAQQGARDRAAARRAGAGAEAGLRGRHRPRHRPPGPRRGAGRHRARRRCSRRLPAGPGRLRGRQDRRPTGWTEPDDVRHVTEIIEDGRYAIACVRARVAGDPLPTRRPPCFFDPRHGLSVDGRGVDAAGRYAARRPGLRAGRRAGRTPAPSRTPGR